MKIYDEAHNLAKAIKDSEEYQNYKKLHDEINNQESVKSELQLFQTQQIELQKRQLSGEKLTEEDLASAQSIYDELIKNEIVAQFFDAERKLNLVMADVSKILGEVMDFR